MFAAGGAPKCICGGRLALVVAPTHDTYRLACVPCGRCSPWFVVVEGVAIEGASTPPYGVRSASMSMNGLALR
jgi:hypothetical protein